jgi:hypothetical protein
VTNFRYAGYVEMPHGDLVRGTHEALIDEATWGSTLRVRKTGFALVARAIGLTSRRMAPDKAPPLPGK